MPTPRTFCFAAVVAVCQLVAMPFRPAIATTIWYEDNNGGKASGTPVDFVERFHQPASFRQASSYINVFMLRTNTAEKLEDAFYTEVFFPYLKKHNIQLALDSGGANWVQASPLRRKVFESNIELLARLKRLGGQVNYVSLQSVLSKPWRGGDYPLDKRVEDIIAFTKASQEVFPQVEIGIIDALPAHGKDYGGAYRQLV